MKKLSFALAIFLCCASFFPFSACQNGQTDNSSSNEEVYQESSFPEEEKEYVKVTFIANDNALEGNVSFNAVRGEDFYAQLTVKDGFAIKKSEVCDVVGEVDTITVIVKNVNYDTRIELEAVASKSKIRYVLNGGNFKVGEIGQESFSESGSTPYHLRKNTNIGTDTIEREGYTQIGWNTAADGNGTHIGLGSRVTVEDGEEIVLYAEWVKWTDASLFTYAENTATEEENDIVITSYQLKNDVDRLVIPHEIEGKKVTRLMANTATGIAIDTLILNENIETVDALAFENCVIEELYIFDNIRKISDDSLGEGLKTMRINSVLTPCYTESYNAQFTETMDRLILNQDKKKLVVWSGCSTSYALRSDLMEAAFYGEYEVINLGINGDTNATFQIDAITHYLHEKDILVHAPETMSAFQMMHDLSASWVAYSMIETNYDLWALADMQKVEGELSALQGFNSIRKNLTKVGLECHPINFNEWGDYIGERPNSPINTNFNTEGMLKFFPLEYVTEQSVSVLNTVYKNAKEKGAKVLYSFSPINSDAITQAEMKEKSWTNYKNQLKNFLNNEYVKIISEPTNYFYPGQYFYDTDYHMTNEGAILRTNQLISDLRGNI